MSQRDHSHCRYNRDDEAPQEGFPPARGPDPDGSQRQTFAALAIRDSVIPPTINLENPDPECDLDYTAVVAKKSAQRSTTPSASAATTPRSF
jgi:hypothetical protein